MTHLVGPNLRDGSTIHMRWSPFLPSGVSVGLREPNPLSEHQVAQLAASEVLIDQPKRGGVPDFMGPGIGPFVVSTAIRDWLTEHQPGAPIFYPVRMRSHTPIEGTTAHKGFYVMGAVPVLDPLDVERTQWDGGMYRQPDGLTLASHSEAPCVVILEKTRGHHFWKTSHRQGLSYWMSDGFLNFIKVSKLRGIASWRKCIDV